MPPRKVGGLAVNAALEQMNLAAGGNGLDDTLANMGSTMSTCLLYTSPSPRD